jgi:hypothetical protein
MGGIGNPHHGRKGNFVIADPFEPEVADPGHRYIFNALATGDNRNEKQNGENFVVHGANVINLEKELCSYAVLSSAV